MGYQIIDALSYLKHEIERFQKRMKEEKSEYGRKSLEKIIEWLFERGLNMIRYAEQGEVDQEIIDYFLDRTKERPDIKRLKELFEKDHKMEEEAKKSLRGKLKLWLWRLKGEILWWWIK